MKFEYYFYNRETDKYIYDGAFQKIFVIFQKTNSFEKVLGVNVIDEYGSTIINDILLEYKEK